MKKSVYKVLAVLFVVIGFVPFFMVPKKLFPIFILLLAPNILMSVKLYKKQKL